MNKQKRARLVAPVTGIAGFFAFLLQFFAGGTTREHSFFPVKLRLSDSLGYRNYIGWLSAL
jgi:hypothetical protein